MEYSKEKQLYWNKPVKEKKKKVYYIPQIGKRKKERLKNGGSEWAVFVKIWLDRPHICEQCGGYMKDIYGNMTTSMQAYMFAHKLPKGMYAKFRLIPENIALVCSIDCHHKLDKTMDLIAKRDLETKLLQLYPDLGN